MRRLLCSGDFGVFEDYGEGLGVDGTGGVGGEGFEEDEEFGYHVGGEVLGHGVFDPGEAEVACAGHDVGHEVGGPLFVDVVDHGAVGHFVALADGALDFAGDYFAAEDVDFAVAAADVGFPSGRRRPMSPVRNTRRPSPMVTNGRRSARWSPV